MDNIYENTNDYSHETFKLPDYVEKLIQDGKYGNKTNEGLYKLEENQVFDINIGEYRKIRKYEIQFIDNVIEKFRIAEYEEGIKMILEDDSKEAKICIEFMIDYIVYSLLTSKEVASKISDCDIAMAEGFNWIPPCALIELIGKNNCKKIVLENWQGNKEIIEDIFSCDVKSKYQYEKYLKAKR